MPLGLKNARATYQRAMIALFHDMMHQELEVYIDDMIIKSKRTSEHLTDLKKLFDRLRKYQLKLNPAKCAFGVPSGKLLGFIVSRHRIEIDPGKIKAITEIYTALNTLSLHDALPIYESSLFLVFLVQQDLVVARKSIHERIDFLDRKSTRLNSSH